MIVKCEKCQTAFKIDDKLVKPTGTKLRCSRCQHVFRVYPPAPAENISGPATVNSLPDAVSQAEEQTYNISEKQQAAEPSASAPPPPNRVTHMPPSSSAKNGPDEDTDQDRKNQDASSITLKSKEKPGKSKRFGFFGKKKKLPSTDSDAETLAKFAGGGKYVPFRRHLMRFAITLIAVIGLIVIPIECYRPIQELYKLIHNARFLIAGIRASIIPEHLTRMNEFALQTIRDGIQNKDEEERSYYLFVFSKLLDNEEIPSQDDLFRDMDEDFFEPFGGKKKFDYEQIKQAEDYWQKRMAASPNILRILVWYKKLLRDAVRNAEESGLDKINLQIMIDSGKQEGFFEKNIAFVIDGASWPDASYCGEPYEIENNMFWRRDALNGRIQYNNNPVFYRQNYFLPRFDSDEYGDWFSVWYTARTGDRYNLVNVDFNGRAVKDTMLYVAATVAFIVIILITVALFIARRVSRTVTRPITELTKGAAEVSDGNYDYEVPVFNKDEIGLFTEQFNKMTKGQKERLNLMETLEKFLSKELAQKAAHSGLVLGGQKAKCTVMFTDFGGFSTITQKLSADEAVSALNTYFEGLIPIIKKYGGFPDKYIGDAIVAMFGAPVPLEDHAERAVACAVEMQWKMRDINQGRIRDGKIVFEMRIGLNSGDVIVGAIGCDQKLEYTSIGETTNLANRMESQCDIGHVMIADGTYQQVKDIFFKGIHITAHPEKVQVKGYPEPVSAYRIYVDNREVHKNMAATDMRNFYVYKEVDHKLKYSPNEIPNVNFKSRAKFM